MKVTAIANGYYDGKVRVPGEAFGLREVEDFSIRWMDTDESKIIAHVKKLANAKPDDKATDDEKFAAEDRARRHQKWLKDKGQSHAEDAAPATRRVNTGGTDGVVGADVPKSGTKLSAAERIAMAEAASGRTGLKAKEADEILAALSASGGSENDDRSRDMAIDQSATAPVDPLDHDGDGRKGGSKPPADNADI